MCKVELRLADARAGAKSPGQFFPQTQSIKMKKAKVICLAGNWVLMEDSRQAAIILAGSIWDVVNYSNREKITILNKESIAQQYQYELWDSIEGFMLRSEWSFVDVDNGTKSWTSGGVIMYLFENANSKGNYVAFEDDNERLAEFPKCIYCIYGFINLHNL